MKTKSRQGTLKRRRENSWMDHPPRNLTATVQGFLLLQGAPQPVSARGALRPARVQGTNPGPPLLTSLGLHNHALRETQVHPEGGDCVLEVSGDWIRISLLVCLSLLLSVSVTITPVSPLPPRSLPPLHSFFPFSPLSLPSLLLSFLSPLLPSTFLPSPILSLSLPLPCVHFPPSFRPSRS